MRYRCLCSSSTRAARNSTGSSPRVVTCTSLSATARPSRTHTVTVPANAGSTSSPYETPFEAITIWSLVSYRTAGACNTTSPRLTVTGFPSSSHTPALSSNSTRVAPVTSSGTGCCAVAWPVATAASAAHTRPTSNPACLLRSKRDRHMALKRDRVQRGVAGHLIGADGHAGLRQHDPARRRELCPLPLHTVRGERAAIRCAPGDATGELHGFRQGDIRGAGGMQLQIAGADPIQPAGDVSQDDRVSVAIDLQRRRLHLPLLAARVVDAGQPRALDVHKRHGDCLHRRGRLRQEQKAPPGYQDPSRRSNRQPAPPHAHDPSHLTLRTHARQSTPRTGA